MDVRIPVVGIALEMLPRVFDLFVQERQDLDRAQGGLGIGLAIVRSLVEAHGGAVRVQSAGKGCGATFTVTLPLATSATPTRPLDPPTGPAAATPGSRILLVDDNQDAAMVLADSLRHDCRRRARSASPCRCGRAGRRDRGRVGVAEVASGSVTVNVAPQPFPAWTAPRRRVLDQTSDDGQSDPEAALRAIEILALLHEQVEHPWPASRARCPTGIRHVHLDGVSHALRSNAMVPPGSVYLAALFSRFANTWPRRAASPSTSSRRQSRPAAYGVAPLSRGWRSRWPS